MVLVLLHSIENCSKLQTDWAAILRTRARTRRKTDTIVLAQLKRIVKAQLLKVFLTKIYICIFGICMSPWSSSLDSGPSRSTPKNSISLLTKSCTAVSVACAGEIIPLVHIIQGVHLCSVRRLW